MSPNTIRHLQPPPSVPPLSPFGAQHPPLSPPQPSIVLQSFQPSLGDRDGSASNIAVPSPSQAGKFCLLLYYDRRANDNLQSTPDLSPPVSPHEYEDKPSPSSTTTPSGPRRAPSGLPRRVLSGRRRAPSDTSIELEIMRRKVAGFTQAVDSSPESTPTPMPLPRKRRRVSPALTHVSETEFSPDSEPSGLRPGLDSPRYGVRSSDSITEIDTPSGVVSGIGEYSIQLFYSTTVNLHISRGH